MDKIKRYLVIVIPLIYLLWSLLLNLQGGSFSLTRSDPEYPYILNGLNCATLNFDNIGHTDHPGTPFQVLTGLFIRMTHLVIGQEPIVRDVLSRPETYLASASFFLSVLTFFLLVWLGRIAMKNRAGITGAVILQCSFFLSNVLIDMPLRYNPDRILILYNLILAGLTVRLLFSENYPVRRYAILTGILMGIGFATKFNYLPVLIIPFLLIPDFRNKFVYGLSFLVSFFVSVIPILNKFKEFRQFISGVASHDGLYGQGSEKIINWKSFGHNFWELLSNNPAFALILIFSLGLIIYFFLRRKKLVTDQRLLITLKAFVLASAIGFILVSKHFKVYYFAPVLSLSGLAFFMIWAIAGVEPKAGRVRRMSGILLLGLLILISAIPVPAQYRSRMDRKNASLLTRDYFAGNVTGKDLLFVEPTWLAGPVVENALVYGISYVAHRHEFYQVYRQLYPNVITWEGAEKNPGLFRTAEADPESILFSGSSIYIYSSPGRNASQLVDYLERIAGQFGTRLIRDTVFVNNSNEDQVIRVRNAEGWVTLADNQYIAGALELSPLSPVSESFPISNVREGDYLEITVRILNNDPDSGCRLIARSVNSGVDGIYFEDSGSLQNIGHGWQLLRLRGKISAGPADGRMVCQVYYAGSGRISIQDLQVRHMGRR